MKGSVVTIGNFDGVHAGHRLIMRQVVDRAREHGLTPVAVTFDPHPTRVIAPARAPKLLTTPEQRARLMREEGIEQVLVLPFTIELSRLTPEEFAERILSAQLNAKIVLVGANFRFGSKQAGDVSTLSELGERLGFRTEIIPAVECHHRVISSSEIRALVERGSVAAAARLLERPYALEGDVVSGHGIGSKQTVPTLNLSTSAELLPATGVYITQTTDLDDPRRRWDSITNIGYRPTFGAEEKPTIETFLLSPLTGETPYRIRVELLRRVRDERKFESPEALKAQIMKDVSRAKAYHRRVRKWVHLPPIARM
jgi:riboflavin kinase/FMN adenylyltransferase